MLTGERERLDRLAHALLEAETLDSAAAYREAGLPPLDEEQPLTGVPTSGVPGPGTPVAALPGSGTTA